VTAIPDPSAIGYPALFGGVLLGSLVPVIPTGALVGAAAAIAMTTGHLSLPLVLLLSTLGALLGDLATFAAAKAGSGAALRWIARGQSPERLDAARARFAARGALLVVVGRLVPAGRIPVLLAAGALDYPWRRLVPAALAACAVWAVAYAALGVLSGGLFDDPVVATLLAALLVLVAGVAASLLSAWRRRRRAAREHASHPCGTGS
jgi:membrane protein DedA with SNARE-associated domain